MKVTMFRGASTSCRCQLHIHVGTGENGVRLRKANRPCLHRCLRPSDSADLAVRRQWVRLTAPRMDQTSCSWCGAGRCATLPGAGLTTTYVIRIYPWLDHVTGSSSRLWFEYWLAASNYSCRRCRHREDVGCGLAGGIEIRGSRVRPTFSCHGASILQPLSTPSSFQPILGQPSS